MKQPQQQPKINNQTKRERRDRDRQAETDRQSEREKKRKKTRNGKTKQKTKKQMVSIRIQCSRHLSVTHVMQFVVETAGVTHGVAVGITSP